VAVQRGGDGSCGSHQQLALLGAARRRACDGPEPDSIDAEIEYRDPATAGEAVLLRDEVFALDREHGGAIHASIVVG
jgi:hypothetical protein